MSTNEVLNLIQVQSTSFTLNKLNSNWLKLIEIDLSLFEFICNQFLIFYFFKSFEKTIDNFKNVSIWKNST